MYARQARSDDLDGVIRCALLFTPYTPTRANVTMLFTMASECGGMFVAVDDSEHVLGFLCALLLPHPFTARPYINVVAWWVPPGWRATGAGLALLRAFNRWCSTQTVDMVRIATPQSSRLGTFLRKAGFEAVEIGWLKGIEWPQLH